VVTRLRIFARMADSGHAKSIHLRHQPGHFLLNVFITKPAVGQEIAEINHSARCPSDGFPTPLETGSLRTAQPSLPSRFIACHMLRRVKFKAYVHPSSIKGR